jgi:hypothetical protein
MAVTAEVLTLATLGTETQTELILISIASAKIASTNTVIVIGSFMSSLPDSYVESNFVKFLTSDIGFD